ncbi:hypothetical protein EV128_11996 [Rhizobium azibense]|nr:hypothetical protein EV128_11996 [Rhizobium azibense]
MAALVAVMVMVSTGTFPGVRLSDRGVPISVIYRHASYGRSKGN